MAVSSTTRCLETADGRAVAAICHATGYMGESAAGHLGDEELLAQLFVAPVLADASGFGVVVDAPPPSGGAERQVVGYCVAVPDTSSFRASSSQIPLLRHVLTRTLWRSPRDLTWLLRWARPTPSFDPPGLLADYPAHFHMNVLPGYHRRGLGHALLSTALDRLRAAGVAGVHLRTSTRNVSALAFYEKLGFVRLATADHSLWRVPGVQSVCMGRRL